MAKDWQYNGNRIELTEGEPKSKKKITGTRLAGVLGLNRWNTPFQMWCEISKVASLPFSDTMYTLAGKAIEPKQIEYVQKLIGGNILSPEEYYGNRYSTMRFDFYPEERIFGGMWDAVALSPKGNIREIYEFKTTKRAEDWVGTVPQYYLAQVLMYGYLSGVKRVHLVVSFLQDDDYNRPEEFEVLDSNTQMFTFNVNTTTIEVDGEHLTIAQMLEKARAWYDKYVRGAISPTFDETKDKQFLQLIRASKPVNDSSLEQLIQEANTLLQTINEIKTTSNLAQLEKQLKSIESGIKETLVKELVNGVDKHQVANYTITRTLKDTVSYDVDLMEQDGTLDRYTRIETKETITLKKTK